MSGLKSGSGDDLWDDEDDEEPDEDEGTGSEPDAEAERERQESTTASGAADSEATTEGDAAGSASEDGGSDAPGESLSTDGITGSTDATRPYIVRRAIQDKSVQFERDERLTFFVHDDVAEGERELRTEVESALGRDVPKFDVREAVYRAALRNREDVLEELVKMGYSPAE